MVRSVKTTQVVAPFGGARLGYVHQVAARLVDDGADGARLGRWLDGELARIEAVPDAGHVAMRQLAERLASVGSVNARARAVVDELARYGRGHWRRLDRFVEPGSPNVPAPDTDRGLCWVIFTSWAGSPPSSVKQISRVLEGDVKAFPRKPMKTHDNCWT